MSGPLPAGQRWNWRIGAGTRSTFDRQHVSRSIASGVAFHRREQCQFVRPVLPTTRIRPTGSAIKSSASREDRVTDRFSALAPPTTPCDRRHAGQHLRSRSHRAGASSRAGPDQGSTRRRVNSRGSCRSSAAQPRCERPDSRSCDQGGLWRPECACRRQGRIDERCELIRHPELGCRHVRRGCRRVATYRNGSSIDAAFAWDPAGWRHLPSPSSSKTRWSRGRQSRRPRQAPGIRCGCHCEACARGGCGC